MTEQKPPIQTVVHKFPIRIEDKVVIEMDPKGHVIKFASQRTSEGEQLMVWALVNPNVEKQPREFQLASTGYPIRIHQRYVGTAQLHGGDIVFHLFEFLPELAAEHAEREASAAPAPAGETIGEATPSGTPDEGSRVPRPLFEGPAV